MPQLPSLQQLCCAAVASILPSFGPFVLPSLPPHCLRPVLVALLEGRCELLRDRGEAAPAWARAVASLLSVLSTDDASRGAFCAALSLSAAPPHARGWSILPSSNLRSLSLVGCATDTGLAAAARCPLLARLDCSRSAGVTQAGASALVSGAAAASLRCLSFASCPRVDDAFSSLLFTLPRLFYLDLSATAVGDGCLAALCRRGRRGHHDAAHAKEPRDTLPLHEDVTLAVLSPPPSPPLPLPPLAYLRLARCGRVRGVAGPRCWADELVASLPRLRALDASGTGGLLSYEHIVAAAASQPQRPPRAPGGVTGGGFEPRPSQSTRPPPPHPQSLRTSVLPAVGPGQAAAAKLWRDADPVRGNTHAAGGATSSSPFTSMEAAHWEALAAERADAEASASSSTLPELSSRGAGSNVADELAARRAMRAAWGGPSVASLMLAVGAEALASTPAPESTAPEERLGEKRTRLAGDGVAGGWDNSDTWPGRRAP